MKPTVKDTKHGTFMYYPTDDYVGKSLELLGEYSELEFEFYDQVVKNNMIVIDGGANIGCFTIPFSKAVVPNGYVFAFEPQLPIYQMLVGNLALNDCLNTVAQCACLGKEIGTIDIAKLNYDRDGNFGGVSAGKNPNGIEVQEGQNILYYQVPVVTIDSLKLPMLSFLKLDIEGMERDALIGGEQTIKEYRPLMYLENNNPRSSPALIEKCFELGYRCYWHVSELDNPNNFFKREKKVFKDYANINMICTHESRDMKIEGGKEIKDVNAYTKDFPSHPWINISKDEELGV